MYRDLMLSMILMVKKNNCEKEIKKSLGLKM